MNILVVEDDPISLTGLQALLQKLGHTVTTATDGAQGWKAICEKPVPIAIVDWMMPVMDGLQLSRKIKADPTTASTCVIMLTAKQAREERIQALKMGVDIFLTKPLDSADLVARLQIAERILDLNKAA